ncbi:DUF1232 domain-containing protein [Pseudomaricurvus alcaniphilus]|uniref:YkvA family protein n=1 Tax=Pseudomaricurvus alcaniphilus TaxID=1166482 RepID=UPI00140C6AE9|nr:YkvA family protein [Pseudomaricurvus alcaniphilus]NHN39095.1 DUF1232 domain-containing protein [Pseudomaricurvus alcaniphilus]
MNISEKRKQAARERFTLYANTLRKQDLKPIFEAARGKLQRVGRSIPETLASIWEDIKTASALMGSYSSGTYREVPWRTLVALGGAMLYFVTPLDAVPDFIPLAGYLDDAFIFKLVFDLVGKDLEDYKRWRDGGLIIDQPVQKEPVH